jgi:hypothetical protein
LLLYPGMVTVTDSGIVSSAGTSVALSAPASSLSGESNLTYTWDAVLAPAGDSPTFSDNDDSTAQNATATVYATGEYLFEVTTTDSTGNSTTADVDVEVDQVPASLTELIKEDAIRLWQTSVAMLKRSASSLLNPKELIKEDAIRLWQTSVAMLKRSASSLLNPKRSPSSLLNPLYLIFPGGFGFRQPRGRPGGRRLCSKPRR